MRIIWCRLRRQRIKPNGNPFLYICGDNSISVKSNTRSGFSWWYNKEADCDNLGSINSFVVVVVVFEGAVVVGVVDGVVDNVVFVVVVDLLVDVFDAAKAGGPHVIPKYLPLPPVKRKQICSRTIFNG